MMADSAEEWKEIPGYHGRYQASNMGRIKAVGHPRRINHTFVMKPMIRGSGKYHGVCLFNPCTYKPRYSFVHVLVMLTFVGPKPAGMQVNHKNLDKHDNRLSNLEYVTFAENARHALRLGVKKRSGKGICLTPQQVREIRTLPRTLSCRFVGKMYSTSHETIRQIRNGERWKCLDD